METFIKVYIKSEDDLPKETGDYITNLGKWSFEPWDEDDNFVWLSGVEWYLKPVEISEISDEEIENAINEYVKYIGTVRYVKEAEFDFRKGIEWYREEQRKRMTK